MLEELHVANLGLLLDARLEPGPGLVVVTGETGAGKTMLLGALQLLSGASASRDRVGPAADELLVEGRFATTSGEVVAARRVTRQGRSRAYEDGSMVTAGKLGETIGPLLEIVAQHDSLTIARPAGVLDLVDSALSQRAQGRLDGYRRAWGELVRLRDEQAEIGGDRRALERELEQARLEAEEITVAALNHSEQSELTTQVDRLRNAEALTEGLTAAHEALGDDGGAIDRVGRVIAELRRLSALDPSLDSIHAQAVASSDALGELDAELGSIARALEHDSGALARVEDRLSLINDLRRRYGESVADVIAYGQAAEARAGVLHQRLTASDTLDEDIAKAAVVVDEAAAALRKARLSAATKLETAARDHLVELGMKDPVVILALEEIEPGVRGADRAVLTFASDSSLPAGQVGRIASGGELSRLVLALRLAAGAGDVPIVAFDEIDAGVGGATALAMGEKLARLASDRQVLCVSHLPQIAAFASSHVVVERDGAAATARTIEGDDRAREIARMLSGLGDTSTGIDHATELLSEAADRLAR